eukprot:s42_g18.t1
MVTNLSPRSDPSLQESLSTFYPDNIAHAQGTYAFLPASTKGMRGIDDPTSSRNSANSKVLARVPRPRGSIDIVDPLENLSQQLDTFLDDASSRELCVRI